jgi:TolB protein
MPYKGVLRAFCVACWCLLSASAQAILNIEITQGVVGAAPIAIIPFAWGGEGQALQDMAEIIASDLARSGQFEPLPREDLISQPKNRADIRFQNWKALGVDNLVIGEVRMTEPGRFAVQFELFDVFKGDQMVGYSFPAKEANLRQTAHRISDIIYESITGKRGAFHTRIAYVSAIKSPGSPTKYVLQQAESDGHNPMTILTSKEPLMSPSWSSDGRQVAYVSFENKAAAIYIQEVSSGARQKVSAAPGINGAPVWSPDGKRLALTLSEKGSPDIFLLDIATRKLRQLTFNTAIDTEPTWTPDGTSILFTSDRSGSAQIYEVASEGGRPKRLTFEGSYNANASVSPDGRQIAMVHKDRSSFRIAVLDRSNGLLRVLTDGSLDESPSFAPNGSMILYATTVGGRGILAAVSADGRMKQRIRLSEGDVREPAWSPFLK